MNAAHIKWFPHKGPDIVDNGIAICKIHQWAFDRGIIGIEPSNLIVLLSNHSVGKDEWSINLIEKYKP